MDCMELLNDIPDNFIDMILTDIPYGVVTRDSGGLRSLDKGAADEVTFDLNDFVSECVRVTSGSIYIFCGFEQISQIRVLFTEADLSTRLIVWEKTNPSPMNGQYIWLSGIEVCFYGKKPKATFNGHCRNTVLRYSSGRSKRHPTEKNLDLFVDLVEVSSNPGDLILDPCIGSGTTAEACLRTDRKFLGCEINPEYFEVCQDRLHEVKEDMKDVKD
jgi:site-specific DNA-methyltransferase (adenine-specific)